MSLSGCNTLSNLGDLEIVGSDLKAEQARHSMLDWSMGLSDLAYQRKERVTQNDDHGRVVFSPLLVLIEKNSKLEHSLYFTSTSLAP